MYRSVSIKNPPITVNSSEIFRTYQTAPCKYWLRENLKKKTININLREEKKRGLDNETG